MITFNIDLFCMPTRLNLSSMVIFENLFHGIDIFLVMEILQQLFCLFSVPNCYNIVLKINELHQCRILNCNKFE